MKIEWNKLSARERDGVVAEYVMGLILVDGKIVTDYDDRIPDYTTDIAAAFLVVQKIKEGLFVFDVESVGESWAVSFIPTDEFPKQKRECTYADTFMDAICIEALRAKGVEVIL